MKDDKMSKQTKRQRPTRAQHQELIDAVNLICDYAQKNLPSGWSIDLTLARDECSSELFDPMGDEIEDTFGESGISSIAAMCDHAHQVEFEGQ